MSLGKTLNTNLRTVSLCHVEVQVSVSQQHIPKIKKQTDKVLMLSPKVGLGTITLWLKSTAIVRQISRINRNS